MIRFHLSQVAGCSIHGNEPPGSIEGREILEWLLVSERLCSMLLVSQSVSSHVFYFSSSLKVNAYNFFVRFSHDMLQRLIKYKP